MRGKVFLTVTVVIEALAAAVLAGLLVFWLPYYKAQSAFPDGSSLYLEANPDGSACARWTAIRKADRYLFEILDAGEAAAETEDAPAVPKFSAVYDGCECRLEDFDDYGSGLLLRITAQRDYRILGKEKVRTSRNGIAVSLPDRAPGISGLAIAPNRAGTASVTWQTDVGNHCLIYLSESAAGEYSVFAEPEGNSFDFTLGSSGDLPIPEFGERHYLRARAYLETDGLFYVGVVSDCVSVQREDFLAGELELTADAQGSNVYSFAWNEVPGDRYLLEMCSGGVWQTLYTCGQGEPRRYTTNNLPSCSDYEFRISVSGTELAGSNRYPVSPETLSITTEECIVYATVWPLQALEIHADADMTSEVVGSAPAVRAFSVLAEENGMFRIRRGKDSYGYIDARYCLVNLPDYLGALCAYDITNSYDSLYMVHEFEIPDVTGTVIDGYEGVALASGGYLVPLLYPAAQKLVNAAKAARDEGYRLKIYDAFRPNCATREIYDKAELIVSEPLPDRTYLDDEKDPFYPAELIDDPEDESGAFAARLPISAPDEDEEERITYFQLLHNDTYTLSNFLARSASLHNIGIALDLTVERYPDREELEMQTRMHDLSLYSVRGENRANANLLSRFMTEAGFGVLTSEWWHFQDNEARSSLQLATQYGGVSPEGWRADARGWRYRNADGSFCCGAAVTIDGETCRFDADGYVVTDE